MSEFRNDPRKMWSEKVAQAWKNLESDDPSEDDTLTIKIDQHIKRVEAVLAEHYHWNDIAISRDLCVNERWAMAKEEVEKEKNCE